MDYSSHTGVPDKKVEVKNFIDHFEEEGYIHWSGCSGSSATWPKPYLCYDLDHLDSIERDEMDDG